MKSMESPITPVDQMPDFSNVADPAMTQADQEWLAGVGIGEPTAEASSPFAARDFSAVKEGAFRTTPERSASDFVVGAKSTTPNIDLKLGGKTLEEKAAEWEQTRLMADAKAAAEIAVSRHMTNAFLASELLRQNAGKDEDDKKLTRV